MYGNAMQRQYREILLSYKNAKYARFVFLGFLSFLTLVPDEMQYNATNSSGSTLYR